jgi:hypothetical protein
MGVQQPDEQAINRSACSLLSRVGDDVKEAIYTCAGCGATKRGFSGWRNHMKKATKYNKKIDPVPPAKPAAPAPAAADSVPGRRRGNSSTNPHPDEVDARPNAVPAVAAPRSSVSKDGKKRGAEQETKAEAPPPQPLTRPAADDASQGPDGKRQRLRGPGNEVRRLAHAEKVRAREAAGAGRAPKPK